MRDQDAWLRFADEAGQLLWPPKACTWSRCAHSPLVRVRAAGSGRTSMAGLFCRKAGQRTRLVFRMLVHHGRKGEKKGFQEQNFASLLDAAHQPLGGNIVRVGTTTATTSPPPSAS
ncbi:transposase [Streptomyces sp. AC602_WCS936]|uniref:transposase n=1 Tax=Streptomyces sp. AC602_WCS936 TaxID=2823685 RepID=UPI0027E4FCE5|nr:transposase [Streptomyces sp. AC602_WCS936]